MTKEELFEVWAPPSAPWSMWCKPVLFAHSGEVDLSLVSIDGLAAPLSEVGLPRRDERVVIVVDLPGETSVAVGLMLAERLGYRPVPLFNGAPPPSVAEAAEVPVRQTVAALVRGAARLPSLSIADDAPPAFLLDSRRRIGDDDIRGGAFDNRSVSFPTDFPSANRLLSSGIHRALVIQVAREGVEPDLAHTLRRWQEAGIEVFRKVPDGDAEPIDVPAPSFFRGLLHRAYELVGLRRNVLGGFGGYPPEPGSSWGAGG